nr:serine/threonine-protein kinase MARK2-like [Microcebus murinus]
MAQALDTRSAMEKLNDYKLLKGIGSGKHGHVMLAVHIPTGRKVALKMMSKKTHPRLECYHMEVKALSVLNHPNILKLLNVIEDEDTICLVTEYASGGDLSRHISRLQRLSEEEARPIFRQLLAAVQHCHENHIVHRDLKPSNILLDKHGNIKLADFGLAGTFSEEDYLSKFCGTPAFSAPEIFLHEKYVGPEVDVWSLGIVLYTMILGKTPFIGSRWKDLKKDVTEGKYEIPDYFSQGLRALLRKFLTVDAKLRPTLHELMKDDWIQQQKTPEAIRKGTVTVNLLSSIWNTPSVLVVSQHGPLTSQSSQSTILWEEQVGDSTVQFEQPYGKTSTSLSEKGQRRKGFTRRLGRFFLRICCILPARQICCMRLNRVVPVTEDS